MIISVILTTYNRIETTLEALKNLFECELPKDFSLNVTIADSNSPDNTLKIIKSKYPDIKIFNVGDNIYWNDGMTKAWVEASKSNSDFYLWLNDDTFLFENAITVLISDFKSHQDESIIVGVTEDNSSITYGGRKKRFNNPLIKPNGFPQKCDFMNGNCVLISRNIFNKVGFLSPKYKHSLGDFDYGLRAIRLNINIYITSKIIGKCEHNDFKWYNPSFSFIKRAKFLFIPNGMPLKEYFYFNFKFFGAFKSMKFLASVACALLLPNLYIKLTKK